MPTGPKGQKRPADAIGAAIMVGKIATGEIDESSLTGDGKSAAAVALGRLGGRLKLRYPDRRSERIMPWKQTLDQLRSHIEQLETDLALADSLISCHAFKIDSAPPETWPKGSILQAAIGRHAVRCAEERLAAMMERARVSARS